MSKQRRHKNLVYLTVPFLVLSMAIYCYFIRSRAPSKIDNIAHNSVTRNRIWLYVEIISSVPLDALSQYLYSLKTSRTIHHKMQEVYKSVLGKTKPDVLMTSEKGKIAVKVVLFSVLTFIVLFMLNYSTYFVTLLVTVVLVTTYQLKGDFWCFDNIILTIALLLVAFDAVVGRYKLLLIVLALLIVAFISYKIRYKSR